MKYRICKPTLILDEARVRKNIRKMADKAKKSGVRFRPHFKTHQSAEIGELFRQAGATAITVSNVDMASYFSEHGWRDITIAFPLNILQIDQINRLAEKVSLHLLLESEETLLFLKKNLRAPAGAWIKIDTGYHRTGIPAERIDQAAELTSGIARTSSLSFRGLLTHSGHSYHASSPERIREIYRDTLGKLKKVQRALHSRGFSGIEISIGDTPTCSLIDDFSGVDEIRPGNFVFYDITQFLLGSCAEEEIALAVACPVVAKHPGRKEIVIYGGAVHLSKDSIIRADGSRAFGYVATKEETGWGPMISGSYVASLSQEHGIVKATEGLLEETRIGDILIILPVHSCLTVNLLKDFKTGSTDF